MLARFTEMLSTDSKYQKAGGDQFLLNFWFEHASARLNIVLLFGLIRLQRGRKCVTFALSVYLFTNRTKVIVPNWKFPTIATSATFTNDLTVSSVKSTLLPMSGVCDRQRLVVIMWEKGQWFWENRHFFLALFPSISPTGPHNESPFACNAHFIHRGSTAFVYLSSEKSVENVFQRPFT